MIQNTLRDATVDAHRRGQTMAAMKGYAAYLASYPDDATMWSNFGALCRAQKLFPMAEKAQRRAYALEPEANGVRGNLANILSDMGKFDESIALRRLILRQHPDRPEQKALIGKCLRGAGRYAEAITFLEPAVAAHPEYADLPLQLAMTQMCAGDYAGGFANYRARWRTDELKPRNLFIPEWQGEPLAGKKIAVLPEQGFGDCVLMARHLPDLKALGGEVTLLVERPLTRLFQGIAGADHVVSVLHPENYDYWINMMDLGAIAVRTDADMRAPTVLNVPQDSVDRAVQIVAPHKKKFRVGVVWTGSMTYRGNAFRSFSHTDFLGLTDLPNLQLFSLYKGPALDDYFMDGTASVIIDTASTDRDFADCAATMQQMDLVITSDTATAHIAGSLGLPTWVVLQKDAFWVYRHNGENTPWYPTMRIFRQDEPLKWDTVMEQVKAALSKVLKA